jgi:CRP-like cAMP-binding protein
LGGLSKQTLRKVVSLLSCLYVQKDGNIFNKGEIGDAAYWILHGKVSFYNTSQVNWVGAEESSILNDKFITELNEASAIKVALNLKNTDCSTFNSIILETKVNEFESGRLFGEIAMIDQSKNPKRVLTAKASTECILIKFSKEVFDMILKERYRKEREQLG